MNKKLTLLVLTGAVMCGMTLPAVAAEAPVVPASPPTAVEESFSLPDSVLYYGTVQGIVKSEDGRIVQLCMTSERYGEYVMNITEQTAWVDSGRCMAADPADVQKGESLYVFHSAVQTQSMPPQSFAFAVVRNTPMDVGCARYHGVEAVSLEEGRLTIVTDGGGLLLLADEETSLSCYNSDEKISLKDIQEGSRIMAWYAAVAESYPGLANASHLMLLPDETKSTEDVLTRGEWVRMLHEQAGKPVADFSMEYTDIAVDTAYVQAVCWAASEGIIEGYSDGSFRPDDAISWEQLATILWRYAGSLMLMDNSGLTQFSDVGEISLFAQPAFAWAYQKGYLVDTENTELNPRGNVRRELAENVLKEFSEDYLRP